MSGPSQPLHTGQPLHALGAAAIADGVRRRRFTAVSVAEASVQHSVERNPSLNAYTQLLADRTLGEAHAVDRAITDGHDPGPLAGVPYGVKNLFDVGGITTRAGSRINRILPPAAHDATLVRRLAAGGAVLLGVQNMDEYAYGFTTENLHDGTTLNPHDTRRVAGGSSGGSAAAVAAGMGAFALGSDTNGSIRVPASFCGLFGLKPTFGRLPRTGSYPFVFDLDHLGALARSAADLALVYDTLQGPDAGDPGCAGRGVEAVSPALGDFPSGLRVAVLDGWFREMAQDQALAAVDRVAEALGTTARVSLPGAEAARSAAFLITAAQGANLHLDDLKRRAGDFDPGTRDRLLAGALLPATLVLQAQRVRRWFRDQVAEVFRSFDILLAPATPCPAPLIGQQTLSLRGAEIPARPALGLLTQPISFIGLPVVAVPVRGTGILPIGVQVIAPPWQERRAFQVAAWLETQGVVGTMEMP